MEFAYSYNGILWSWVIFINRSWNEDDLGEGNLIFWCTGPTDSKFWQIKIIILISQKIFSFFFYSLYFFWYNIFLLDHNKIHKKQKFSALDIVEWRSTEMWSVSFVTCTQVSSNRWSIFLFFDVPTLKLRIIIIILPTDQTNIIPTTKN